MLHYPPRAAAHGFASLELSRGKRHVSPWRVPCEAYAPTEFTHRALSDETGRVETSTPTDRFV